MIALGPVFATPSIDPGWRFTAAVVWIAGRPTAALRRGRSTCRALTKGWHRKRPWPKDRFGALIHRPIPLPAWGYSAVDPLAAPRLANMRLAPERRILASSSA